MASKPKNNLPLPAGRLRRSPDERAVSCKHCSADFTTKSNRAMYCSTKCEMAYRRAHRPLPDAQVKKARERASAWYAANKERAVVNVHQWRQKNQDLVGEYRRHWAEKNPDYIKEVTANRRAAIKARPGKITKSRINELMALQKCKCVVCHSVLDKYHVDHIMPLALGGDNTNENIQLLCPSCNLSKSAKHPVEFMQQKGYLL